MLALFQDSNLISLISVILHMHAFISIVLNITSESTKCAFSRSRYNFFGTIMVFRSRRRRASPAKELADVDGVLPSSDIQLQQKTSVAGISSFSNDLPDTLSDPYWLCV